MNNLSRDAERQGNNNTTERQSNTTQLARNSHFSKKNWLPRVGLEPTTMYMYMYMNGACTWHRTHTLYERMVRCNSQSPAEITICKIYTCMVQNVILSSFPSPSHSHPSPDSSLFHTLTSPTLSPEYTISPEEDTQIEFT